MKITVQMHAFLAPTSSATPQSLQTEKGVRGMHFFPDKEYWIGLGYTHISPAEITVDVPDVAALVENKVVALREEIKATRADATAKVTKLEGQIQQLLCLENSAAH